MPRTRAFPVTVAVVVTELVMALAGAEISFEAMQHDYSYRGTTGLLLRSFGAPLAAPWHSLAWQYAGPSLVLGLVIYLLLLGITTAVLTGALHGPRSTAALFIGIWGLTTLSLAVAETVRLLLAGGEQARAAAGEQTTLYAFSYGPAMIHHAVYYGWIPAIIGTVTGSISAHWAAARQLRRSDLAHTAAIPTRPIA
ncbi:hypothetical protein M6D93_14435 [Jatrophihabitans telluris]|uniref:Uncharacterized protein n=1 Tax=Jatrophihabitans telluris TaxID=2038343 RepID=A0ABY4QUY9_9ACTN|nr:hypothetical protein [Jatrophihabitans telluris]UQX87491.1 hypothetical protein M6D93_14435 [Jatrophihabitans telluris]